MISFQAMFVGCSLSLVVGVFIPAIMKRLSQRNSRDSNSSNWATEPRVTELTTPQSQKGLERFASSIYELTSRVDSQVGQHCLRLGEITSSLEVPNDRDSASMLIAGKMLIAANQQLQSELEEAKTEILRQQEIVSSCMRESLTDALTGIANRRALDLELNRVLAQYRRDGVAFSVLMIDIDYFKRVNDKYGHMIGDQLLKSFSRCLTDLFRGSDFVARFGGEEFLTILPNTTIDAAIMTAERVRNIIAINRFSMGELDLQLTASIGVKQVDVGESAEELLKKADQSLYAAKDSGRNRCFFCDGESCCPIEPDVQSDESADVSHDEESVDDCSLHMPNSQSRSSTRLVV